METKYDILILGGGPIAAATAHFLAKSGAKGVGLVTKDPSPDDDHSSTYLYAGGSVRWYWDDPLKAQMTRETADLITSLSEKADLSLLRDNYLFLNRGKYVPSLNLSGAKLVKVLLDGARERGVEVREGETVASVTAESGECRVSTDKGSYRARKVLLAMGAKNSAFMPGYDLELEKRQLFVLDLTVGETEEGFPHTILPIGGGVAYVFVKKTADGMRFLVGQEDVVEADERPGEEDYFPKLLEAGLGDAMPFLKAAKVEKVLWGMDAGNKTLRLENREGILFAANCGSAVRSCAHIGRTCADALLADAG